MQLKLFTSSSNGSNVNIDTMSDKVSNVIANSVDVKAFEWFRVKLHQTQTQSQNLSPIVADKFVYMWTRPIKITL